MVRPLIEIFFYGTPEPLDSGLVFWTGLKVYSAITKKVNFGFVCALFHVFWTASASQVQRSGV